MTVINATMNLLLLLSGIFLLTLLLGTLLERVHIPWIFASLLLGTGLALWNPFASLTGDPSFSFLAQLGMSFLLFVIGFEIDGREMMHKAGFIVRTTFFIVLFEALCGSLLLHTVFNLTWELSLLVSMAFATVGEALLIPILDEFKLSNTTLGQTIIGIGTFDDIIEVLLLVMVSFMLGTSTASGPWSIFTVVGVLAALFLLTTTFVWLRKDGSTFRAMKTEPLFLFCLFVLFLFIGIGSIEDVTALGAILAGISLRTFLPVNQRNIIEKQVRSLCYGFFAPIFFVSVGISLNIQYLLAAPLLVILVLAVSTAAKLGASWLVARKKMEGYDTLLLGVGLSARFSTSIIIIKILWDHQIVTTELFSVITASSMLLSFIVPLAFSILVRRRGRFVLHTKKHELHQSSIG